MSNPRQPAHPVHPMFINRWSPRSLTNEAVPHDVLMTILEAGRWAPSAYNAQPWRFIYALRGGQGWDGIFGAINEGNQSWVHRAGALVAIASAKQALFPGKTELAPNAWHSFDTGSAWMSMLIQAEPVSNECQALGANSVLPGNRACLAEAMATRAPARCTQLWLPSLMAPKIPSQPWPPRSA